VILADPNLPRLEVGRRMGAAETIQIQRGGGQAEAVKAVTSGGQGAWVAIDATGVPDVTTELVTKYNSTH